MKICEELVCFVFVFSNFEFRDRVTVLSARKKGLALLQ